MKAIRLYWIVFVFLSTLQTLSAQNLPKPIQFGGKNNDYIGTSWMDKEGSWYVLGRSTNALYLNPKDSIREGITSMNYSQFYKTFFFMAKISKDGRMDWKHTYGYRDGYYGMELGQFRRSIDLNDSYLVVIMGFTDQRINVFTYNFIKEFSFNGVGILILKVNKITGYITKYISMYSQKDKLTRFDDFIVDKDRIHFVATATWKDSFIWNEKTFYSDTSLKSYTLDFNFNIIDTVKIYNANLLRNTGNYFVPKLRIWHLLGSTNYLKINEKVYYIDSLLDNFRIDLNKKDVIFYSNNINGLNYGVANGTHYMFTHNISNINKMQDTFTIMNTKFTGMKNKMSLGSNHFISTQAGSFFFEPINFSDNKTTRTSSNGTYVNTNQPDRHYFVYTIASPLDTAARNNKFWITGGDTIARSSHCMFLLEYDTIQYKPQKIYPLFNNSYEPTRDAFVSSVMKDPKGDLWVACHAKPTYNFLDHNICALDTLGQTRGGTDIYFINLTKKFYTSTENNKPNPLESPQDIDGKEVLSFNVYPNPAHQDINLQYILKEKQSVDIAVYDMRGRKVQELKPNSLTSEGAYYEQYKLDNLKQGNYLIKLRVGKEVLAKKIVVK